jgi:3-phenylpropionate/trans-cinnamate dioxygenase ferredoxin subunit
MTDNKVVHVVASTAELPIAGRKLVRVAGREIGLFNVGGSLRAVVNVCPHRGAPVCRGTLMGTALPSRPGEFVWGKEGEILRCPWHGWEFDLLTGQALTSPGVRLKLLPVSVDEDRVLVWL